MSRLRRATVPVKQYEQKRKQAPVLDASSACSVELLTAHHSTKEKSKKNAVQNASENQLEQEVPGSQTVQVMGILSS